MPQQGPWLRVFVGLLLSVVPPILILVAGLVLARPFLREAGAGLVSVVFVVGLVAWAGMLAIVFSRVLDRDMRSVLALAQRGERRTDSDGGAASQQLAVLLDERNRQMAALARQAREVPIDAVPRRVVAVLVSAVRSVMGDPTWRLAILSSDNPELLGPGVYHALEENREPEPIGDLERWASVSESDMPVRRIDGLWGAFTIVTVSVSDRLRGVLYAPWEGRMDPTPADIDLLSLVAQLAGTALEHSLLYAQVRSQADELTRLAAIQTDFLRGVTHDLQTPLTSIGALAGELQAEEGLPQRAGDDLASIAHQADRLRRMVSQLLVASRLEAGGLSPQQEVFAVPPLVERTWSALRADRPFELAVDGAPHLAVADSGRVEQVLWALLDNAVKYSPAGSAIHVKVRPVDGQLAVTIEDQGIGMNPETRSRAFEQFYRAGDAMRLAPDGSGVGLYAARGLMEAMGGSIQVDSEVGAGASITLFLPAEPSGVTAE